MCLNASSLTTPMLKASICILALLSPLVSYSTDNSADKIYKAHAITTLGSPKYPADFTHFEYVNPNAPKGGSLTTAAVGTFDNFNYYAPKGTAPIETLLLLTDELMTHSLDEHSGMYGLIAESIEYPESREWIAFNINPSAKFSDGTPITADDIVYSFNAVIQASPYYEQYWADVAKVETKGKLRVRFTSKNPENKELPLILGQVPVLAKNFWSSRGLDKPTLDRPVVSGPYTIGDFEAGRYVEFKRNKNYWAKNLPSRKGMFNFDTVKVDYYKDGGVAFEAFKAGNIDFRLENTAKNWATGYDIANVKKGKIIKLEIPDNRSKGMTGVLFNLRKEMFKDQALRKAIGMAFDFEWTNKNIFYGLYSRTNSYYSNSEFASTGLPGPLELKYLRKYKDKIPKSVFTEEFTQPINDSSGNNRKALREAKKLLKGAGYNIVNQKLIHPKTQKPVEFEIIANHNVYDRVVNPYIKNLERLGIKLTYRIVDTAQFISRVNAYDYDALLHGYPQSLSPGNEQRIYFGSETAGQPNGRNYMGIKNPAIDGLIEDLVNIKTREEQIAVTRALDRVLLNNYYATLWHHSTMHRAAYWNKYSRPEINPKYDPGLYYTRHTWWSSDRDGKLSKLQK